MSGGGATDIEEEELAMAETGAAPSLDKRVAVITGGTRGIGRGIAEAFAAEGAAVVLSWSSCRWTPRPPSTWTSGWVPS